VISPGYPVNRWASTPPSGEGGQLEGGAGQHPDTERQTRAKRDRWLVGLLAGAALMYLAGKLMGLGRSHVPNALRPRKH